MGEMHGAALRFQPDPDVGIMVCALISFHHRDFGRMVRADLFYFFYFFLPGERELHVHKLFFFKKKNLGVFFPSPPPPFWCKLCPADVGVGKLEETLHGSSCR